MKTKHFLMMATLAVAMAMTSVMMISCSKEDTPSIDSSSLDVTDPEGTLEVSETNIVLPSDGKPVKLIATYKSPKGLYEPTAISMYYEDGSEVLGVQDGDNMTFDITKEGTYTVSASTRSIKIKVSRRDGN